MSALPSVSVIIPTYNRKQMLERTLDTLARQDWPAGDLEVIVVDDGSNDGTDEIAREEFPFELRYLYQTNQGDAAARNTGALESQADFLVFLDDDILVSPDYLRHLIQSHDHATRRIVAGTAYLWLNDDDPLEHRLPSPLGNDEGRSTRNLSFVELCSNNMSLRRSTYFDVGMMQDLDFKGSSMWCDVDFAYRAHRAGYEFWRSTKAICWHQDHTERSLESRKRRMHEAAYRAVSLFQKHPDLLPHLPMFNDKTPIRWQLDPPPLVARKLLRHITSSRPALWFLERLALSLERSSRTSEPMATLYRWIVGGYIWRGYRRGLREFGADRQR